MKTKFFVLLLFTFTSTKLFAQDDVRPMMKEKMESMKIAFLSDRLNLTPEEAKSFWPVYNQYQNELEELRKTHRQNLINARDNFDSMSDKEVEKVIDNEISFRQQELDVTKKYLPQLKKVLPVKKVARLYKAEEEFKLKVLKMLQEKRQNRMENKFGK